VIGSTPPLPPQVSSRCSVTATMDSLGWHPTALTAPAMVTVTPLGYFRVFVLHCLSGGCQRLGFLSNLCNARTVLVATAPPLFFFHCGLLRVSRVVLSIIYFVGVYGKGFAVDSSPYIYLSFSFRPLSWRAISYFCVAGVRLVLYQRDLGWRLFPWCRPGVGGKKKGREFFLYHS